MAYEPELQHGSRPSGVLGRRKGFSVEKFIGLTVVLAVGAGVAVAASSAMDRSDEDDEPNGTTGLAGAADPPTPEAEDDPAEPAARRDIAAPSRGDLGGGSMRLDIPEPWWDDPAVPPSEAGPDIETPQWQ